MFRENRRGHADGAQRAAKIVGHPPGKGIEIPVVRLKCQRVAVHLILALTYQTSAPEADAHGQQHGEELEGGRDGDQGMLQVLDSRG